MKKLAAFILTVVFTASITLAIVNQTLVKPVANMNKTIQNYATILPIGPPPFPKDKKKKGDGK